MTERFALPTAVHLLVINGENVLMAQRMNTGYEDGKFSVPAGHIDQGESARSAMIREALEEIDFHLKEDDLRFELIQHKHDPVDGAERLDFFFSCSLEDRVPRIMEPHKCCALEWSPLSMPPPNTIEYVRNALAAIRAGEKYAEFGW